MQRLEQFKSDFLQYANTQVMGAVAAMVAPEGLYVLTQSGDAVKIKNNAEFQPRHW